MQESIDYHINKKILLVNNWKHMKTGQNQQRWYIVIKLFLVNKSSLTYLISKYYSRYKRLWKGWKNHFSISRWFKPPHNIEVKWSIHAPCCGETAAIYLRQLFQRLVKTAAKRLQTLITIALQHTCCGRWTAANCSLNRRKMLFVL